MRNGAMTNDARHGKYARHDETSTKNAKENATEFKGEATNGYVKVTATGDRKIKDIVIDPAIIDAEDAEMLQDLVVMAVNDVLTKVEKETEATIGKYTKGIPGF
jgi:DNA-binding YbaB/EbfC family protein